MHKVEEHHQWVDNRLVVAVAEDTAAEETAAVAEDTPGTDAEEMAAAKDIAAAEDIATAAEDTPAAAEDTPAAVEVDNLEVATDNQVRTAVEVDNPVVVLQLSNLQVLVLAYHPHILRRVGGNYYPLF